MPSIFDKTVIFDLMYQLIDNLRVSDALTIFNKYAQAENLDSSDFHIQFFVYVLVRYSQRYKGRIKFIRAKDLRATLLCFILYLQYYYGKNKVIELADFLKFKIYTKIETMDKAEAIKTVYFLIGEIFESRVPYDLKYLVFAHSKIPIETSGIDMLHNIIDNLTFVNGLDKIVDIIKNTDEYVYVIVNEQIIPEYNLNYISLPESLDVNRYLETLQYKLAYAFIRLLKSSKDLIPQYFYTSNSYADFVINNGLSEGYKIYFINELEKLINENKEIAKFIKKYVMNYLLETNDEFKMIKRYIRLKARAKANDKTNKEIETILNKYPLLKDTTDDKLREMVNDMYTKAYNELVTNIDRVIELLRDEGLINFVRLPLNYSLNDFISELLEMSIIYTDRPLEFITTKLNYTFKLDEYFLMLEILDDKLKGRYKIEDYLTFNSKKIPIVVSLE